MVPQMHLFVVLSMDVQCWKHPLRRDVIPHALKGTDILATAETGNDMTATCLLGIWGDGRRFGGVRAPGR